MSRLLLKDPQAAASSFRLLMTASVGSFPHTHRQSTGDTGLYNCSCTQIGRPHRSTLIGRHTLRQQPFRLASDVHGVAKVATDVDTCLENSPARPLVDNVRGRGGGGGGRGGGGGGGHRPPAGAGPCNYALRLYQPAQRCDPSHCPLYVA